VGTLDERKGEVPRFFADVFQCRELLGHHPRIDLVEGIERTVAWARANRSARDSLPAQPNRTGECSS